MTEKEAVSVIKKMNFCGLCTTGPCVDCERKQAKDAALSALEEIQQYRAIGTVEECREAAEKQKPKMPVTYQGTNQSDCPTCGAIVRGIKDPFGDWCSKCGQALDWSKSDDE